MTKPLFTVSVPEMVYAIVMSYLKASNTSGTFGKLTVLERSEYRVEVKSPEKCFIVKLVSTGWAVSFKGFTAVDSDLESAAWTALTEGDKSSVSRNYPVHLTVVK